MKIMAIHAEAVEILVSKGKFEPQVAIGIAEAIEVSMNLTQLVTVPILDARLQALKAELVRWVFLAMVGNVALSTGTAAVLKAMASWR
jgi:hypothetical protein